MNNVLMKLFRFERLLYLTKIPILPQLIKLFIRVFFNATIPYTCCIGKGTRFPHGGQGVILHENTVIGNNCTIQANVVIGGRKGIPGAPVIGNDVLIGVGAVVIGSIRIGNHAAIGANAVVTKDIPDNAVAIGVPAYISRYLLEEESVK